MTDEQWNNAVRMWRGDGYPISNATPAERYALWVSYGCVNLRVRPGPDHYHIRPEHKNAVLGYASFDYFIEERIPEHLVQFLDKIDVGYLFARHNDPIVRPWLEARWNGGGL